MMDRATNGGGGFYRVHTYLVFIDTRAPRPQVNISESGLQAIVDLSGGDMRKAVTAMQSASQFYAGTEVV